MINDSGLQQRERSITKLDDNWNQSFDISIPKIEPKKQLQQSNGVCLDNGKYSLALISRQSIEKGLAIPRQMLSHSDNHQQNNYHHQSHDDGDEIHSQSISSKSQINMKKQSIYQIEGFDQKWLIQSLELQKLLPKRFPENTKNVLRNFGNAQNQYILYHKKAQQIIKMELQHPQNFNQWVRSLKLQTFEHFRQVWSSSRNKLYRRLYKKLCWQFYEQSSIPYILSSRIRNVRTRQIHLKYIHRFLEGLQNPDDFTYFKKNNH